MSKYELRLSSEERKQIAKDMALEFYEKYELDAPSIASLMIQHYGGAFAKHDKQLGLSMITAIIADLQSHIDYLMEIAYPEEIS